MNFLTRIYVKAEVLRFAKDERGVTAIEYAIIGVAIATAVALAFDTNLSAALSGAMTKITAKVNPS